MSMKFDSVAAQIEAATRNGVMAAALQIESEAVARTPFREGHLRDSAETMPLDGVDGPGAVVAYSSVYAAYQHEGVGFNHPTGGQAKFLSSAAEDSKEAILQAFAASIKGHI